MADNRHQYGFRWVGSVNGSCYPKPVELTVATAYQAQVSAEDVDLNIGDPVGFNDSDADTGFIQLAANDSTGIFGVIVGFSNAKVDANGKARPSSYLPGGTTWTTEATRSKVLVIPFENNIFEIDCVNNGTVDTLAEYRALINKNADLTYSRDATNSDRPKANPLLDLTSPIEATASFRVWDVGRTMENQDFSGAFVKLRVIVNEGATPMFRANST